MPRNVTRARDPGQAGLPPEGENTLTTFRELGVEPEIAAALEAAGAVEPFPIQSMALPLGLAGQDVIGQARTGTGKTYAFGVAMLQRLSLPGNLHGKNSPQGLVVTPTRELALQVANDLENIGKAVGARVLTVFGGRSYEPQVEGLRAGVDVVVGTPGRLLDLSQQRYLDLSEVCTLVLDEADRMLDLGFLPDVERILTLLPPRRQTMLFSATMPGEIVTLSRRYLRQPTHVHAETADESRTVPSTKQHVFRTHPMDKPEVLARVLQAGGGSRAMVFCRTKRRVDNLTSDLTDRGFKALAVHGDLGQEQREKALRSFRNGKVDVLVATDVAARGLDVDDVTHVVNYACPDDDKEYLHRIGRTSRAGKEGTAVTFVDWEDTARWRVINEALDLSFSEPAETYSTSDHLYEDLGIPKDATGRIGPPARGARGRQQGRQDRRTGSQHGRPGDQHGDHQRNQHGNQRGSQRGNQRRSRQRRRTRAGQPVGNAAGSPTDNTARADQSSQGEPAAPDHAASMSGRQGGDEASPSRRRRRRGGQGNRNRAAKNQGGGSRAENG